MSAAPAAPPAEVPVAFRMVPVGDLHPNPRNLRADLGDLGGLASSIKDGGVRQPLRVTPRDEGGYWIVAGHRRHAAAAQAGLSDLPCVVDGGERLAAADVTDMLVENTQREDLTDAERVHGVQQLLDLGLSASTIGERTGLGVKHTRQLAGVARDQVAREALGEGLTLDHALIVAKFKGDETAQARLMDSANDAWRFKRVAAELQAEAKVSAEVKKLRESGAEAYARDEWDSLDHPAAAPLHHLVDAERQPYPDGYDHSGCGGCVFVVQSLAYGEGVAVRDWCRDPGAHGHGIVEWATGGSARTSDPDDDTAKEAQREERRRVIRCNREWRAARTVRQQHLHGVLHRRAAAKGSLALVTTLAADGAQNDSPTVLAALLGVEVTGGAWRPQRDLVTSWLGESPSDARRTLAMVAMFSAHVEQQDLHDSRWRQPAKGGRAEVYLDWLVEHTGYVLAPVESLAIGRTTQDAVDALHAEADETAL